MIPNETKTCVAAGCKAHRLPVWVFCQKHLDQSRAGAEITRKARKVDPTFAAAIRDGMEYAEMEERAERLGII